MDFSKHYFVEGDGTAELSKFAKDVVGGRALDQHKLDLDSPTTNNSRSSRSSNNNDGGDKNKTDKTDSEPVEPVDSDEPKKLKPMPHRASLRGVGYVTAKSHAMYDVLYDDIISSGDFKDQIIGKPRKRNFENFEGVQITFVPRPVPEGDEVVAPQYARTMYLLKSKEGKSPTEWSAIGFVGKPSYTDGIKTFVIDNQLANKKKIFKLLGTVKFDQAIPKNVNDPYIFANWAKQTQPAKDKAEADKLLGLAVADEKKLNDSFSFHYECDTLMEALHEDDVVINENVVDDALNGTFKGIGGGIKTLLKRPARIRLSNPAKLIEYFPKGSTFQVKEGSYTGMNMLAEKSASQWAEAKKEFGLVAQQFIKMKSLYVNKIYDVEMKQPKNEEQQEKFEQGIAKLVDKFEIDTEKYDFQVNDIKVYELTNKGKISTMVINVWEDVQPEPDENGSGSQNEADGDNTNNPEPDNNPDDEDGVEDMTDVGGEDDKERKNEKTLFFIGFDKAGNDFFTKTMRTDFKSFVRRYNNKAAVAKGASEMDMTHGQLLKKSMGNSNSFVKRSGVSNEELKDIIDKFTEKVSTNGNVDGPKKSTNGEMQIMTFVVKGQGGNGKVLFINDGMGTPGRILVSPKAKPLYHSTQVDPSFRDEQGSGYESTDKKQETDN